MTAPSIIARGFSGLDILDWRLRVFDGLALKFSDGVYSMVSGETIAFCVCITVGRFNRLSQKKILMNSRNFGLV